MGSRWKPAKRLALATIKYSVALASIDKRTAFALFGRYVLSIVHVVI